MFKIFDILTETKKEAKLIQKKPISIKTSVPSIKMDAMKILDKILDDLVEVNNPKVDALRKLYMDINMGKLNHADMVTFLKQPICVEKPKKKKSKSLISGL